MSDGRPRSSLVVDVLAYVLARLLLVVVLTAVIFGAGHLLGVRDFPLVMAILFALVIALPLGIWVFAPLRRRATASIAVINAVRPRSGKVDMKKVVDHFNRRCRAVKQVPFDPHLEEGAEISLDRLTPETREAVLELAAVVAGGFSGAKRPDAQSG